MMTDYDSCGFEELPHSADWALRLWGGDFPALLTAAVRGMQSLMGLALRSGPRVERMVTITGADREEWLVAALAEVLFLLQNEGLGVESCQVRMTGDGLALKLGLSPAVVSHKEIKAVTYHGLSIQESARGLEARLVFDV